LRKKKNAKAHAKRERTLSPASREPGTILTFAVEASRSFEIAGNENL
jgi:hypothetical protein